MNVKRILSLALAGSLLTGTALLVAGCSKGSRMKAGKRILTMICPCPLWGRMAGTWCSKMILKATD